MFDSLEGLDYGKGELSRYVSRILQDVEASKESGDLRYIPIRDLQVGDVCVQHYSSHLVTTDDFSQWGITRRKRDDDEQVLIIPKVVLERIRSEKENHADVG
jgi:hypothetical protein